jgi:molybdenum cofactor biosynthesis protein B
MDTDEGGDGHDHGHEPETVGVAVLTVSSTRTLDDDPAGDAIAAAFEHVADRDLVPDDHDRVQDWVNDAVTADDGPDAVVTTGGTGVSPDDVTVEAVGPLLDKRLPGFGELFRRRSTEEVGTRAIASRATAGIAGATPVFCLPGSENAARLGAEIAAAEAGHLAGLARRTE